MIVERKHTAGDWTVRQEMNPRYGGAIAEVFVLDSRTSLRNVTMRVGILTVQRTVAPEEREYNLRLITAAPDLFDYAEMENDRAAIEGTKGSADLIQAFGWKWGFDWRDKTCVEYMRDQALKKATEKI